MKIYRSTKCSLKYLTASKKKTLAHVLTEYTRVVNCYIDLFWENCPAKVALLRPVLYQIESWFGYNLRQVAAKEAVDMIVAERKLNGEDGTKPKHRGKCMCLTSTIANLQLAKKTNNFDCWLHLRSIGNKIILDLPIKLHKHFHKLAKLGKRLNSYIVTMDYVQFCFEIQTGPKLEKINCIGIDTGINALATLHTGEQLGVDIKQCIERVNRKKHGSKAQKRSRRALRQRIDEVARDTVQYGNLVVVERLKNITKKTKIKRRLIKTMRRFIGNWNVRYWLNRLQQQCELNRVSFRTVSPYYTSQTCPACGYTNKKNRKKGMFLCQNCNHTGKSDVIAAKNILVRFISGPYGAGCEPKLIGG